MELCFNSVETIANLNASAAFQVDSGKVFKEDCDIVPTIIDDMLDNVPDDLRYYFDFTNYARDVFMCDYYFDSGHVFVATEP